MENESGMCNGQDYVCMYGWLGHNYSLDDT